MTAKTDLGRLQPVELQNCWEREDTDFTPWLAQEANIALLGDAIGIELEVQGEEVSVGPFRADILCRDTANDQLVIIENQLGKTDHGHLGQTITYAAGLDAATVIWISSQFTEEHRAALDWLNRITRDDICFFGVEIELWKIGDSIPAPKFNMVSKPNDWIKTLPEPGKLRKSHQRRVDYWASFGSFLKEQGLPFKPPKPCTSNWIGYGVGRSGVSLCAIVNQDEASVTVVIVSRKHPAWFDLLHDQREEIELELGFQLLWDRKPDKKQSHIRVDTSLDSTDREQWPTIHQWLLGKLSAMRETFRPRLKELGDSAWQAEEEEEEEEGEQM